jgi:hypothetical protein
MHAMPGKSRPEKEIPRCGSLGQSWSLNPTQGRGSTQDRGSAQGTTSTQATSLFCTDKLPVEFHLRVIAWSFCFEDGFVGLVLVIECCSVARKSS